MVNNNTTPEQCDGEGDSSLPQRLREFTEEVAYLKEAGGNALTDRLAHWLTAHYAAAAKSAARNAGAEGLDLKTLRGLIADVVALRRGDHSAERLLIEREQLDLNRELSKERMEKLFWEWANKPENKRRICDAGLSASEKAERIRRILFGRDPTKPRDGLPLDACRDSRERPTDTLSDSTNST